MTGRATTDQPSARAEGRRTRRQLLAGGTGALAAVLTAEALAGSAPAQAANGDNLILGQSNGAANTTILGSTAPDSDALLLDTKTIGGSGAGLRVQADSGAGVAGGSQSGAGV